MADVLQGLGFNIEKVLDGSRAQMAEGISRLKNRLSVAKNSYGFFFYAGHGVQHNGVNYLVPATADIPNANYLGDTSISVQTMLSELNDTGNNLNIVVLDACRDFPAAWSRSMNRGLTVVTNQPADSIIVYATSAGSTASDGTGRNGLFTSQLLKNLKISGLEVSEVFKRTGADVSQVSNRVQIPAVYNQFFGNAYLGTSSIADTAIQTYRIGDTGPADGIIFYDKGVFTNGWRYLEAAPQDIGPVEWGTSDIDVSGTEHGIGKGKNNTMLIVAVSRRNNEKDTAAELCTALEFGGCKDWFLPSLDELD
jgi:hypothetical protein